MDVFITKIDKYSALCIFDEAHDVLQKHFASRNIKFTRGPGSYNSNSVNFKLTGHLIHDAAGTPVNSPEATYYEVLRQMNKLPDIGSTFMHQGTRYKIVGASRRARKYPIMCTSVGGDERMYSFTVNTLQNVCK